MDITDLESARSNLLKTEQYLGRLKGERSAIESQLKLAREELAGLGISEAEIPGYLAKLAKEGASLKEKIASLEAELGPKLNAAD